MKSKKTSSSKSTGKARSRRRVAKRARAVFEPTRERAQSYLGAPSVRGDSALSLTRSQFTATTPLTSWEVLRASSPGGMRVRGREQVASLFANTINSNLNFQYYNGGNPNSSDGFMSICPRNFKRLASICAVYELYCFNSIKFTFVAASPTTVAGMIALDVEYDVNQPLPAAGDFNYVNNHISSVCGNIYSDMSMEMVKSLCLLPKYTCGPLANASGIVDDQRIKFQCEVQGVYNVQTALGGQLFGLLVADYDVEFFSPRPGLNGGSIMEYIRPEGKECSSEVTVFSSKEEHEETEEIQNLHEQLPVNKVVGKESEQAFPYGRSQSICEKSVPVKVQSYKRTGSTIPIINVPYAIGK